MNAASPVVSAPAVKVWPPPLTLRSRSTSGSASLPRLWNGPASLIETGSSSCAAAPLPSSFAVTLMSSLPLLTSFLLLNVSLMTAVAFSSLPPLVTAAGGEAEHGER